VVPACETRGGSTGGCATRIGTPPWRAAGPGPQVQVFELRASLPPALPASCAASAPVRRFRKPSISSTWTASTAAVWAAGKASARHRRALFPARAAAPVPRAASVVLPLAAGIDEHFFTRRKGYATTFCDLHNHKVYDVVLGPLGSGSGALSGATGGQGRGTGGVHGPGQRLPFPGP